MTEIVSATAADVRFDQQMDLRAGEREMVLLGAAEAHRAGYEEQEDAAAAAEGMRER